LNWSNFDQTGARSILEEHPRIQIGIVESEFASGKSTRLWPFML
jgi:hypothetical protein